MVTAIGGVAVVVISVAMVDVIVSVVPLVPMGVTIGWDWAIAVGLELVVRTVVLPPLRKQSPAK